MCDYRDTTGQRRTIFVSCLCIYHASCGCVFGRIAGVNDAQMKAQD